MVWLTTACNLACSYCYEGQEKQNQSLSEDTAHEILRYMISHTDEKQKELLISFHGGEPFLNYEKMEYFCKEINHWSNKKEISVKYQVSTNATVRNDAIIRFLKTYKNDIELSVSLDGKKQTHDAVRLYRNGQGSYEEAVKNSFEFMKIFPDLRARMTFGSQTVGALSENVLHIADLGFQTIVAIPDYYDKQWDKDTFEALRREIREIKKGLTGRKLSVNLLEPLRLRKNAGCTGGISYVNIFPNGDLYPCTMAAGMDEFWIGNIKTGICKSKLDKIKTYSNTENLVCEGCTYYDYCNCTRCKIINKLVNGSYNSPIFMECNMNSLLYEENGYVVC